MNKKILIGIFVILVVVLVSGFFIYDRFLILEKTPTSEEPSASEETVSPEEKLPPKLIVSAPSELEVVAYKSYIFNFSIKNEEEYAAAENINISLGGITGTINQNNVLIEGGKSKSFEVRLDGLLPGEYLLSVNIKGEPAINITKDIFVKSQIVVGLEQYHTYNQIWKEALSNDGLLPEGISKPYWAFIDYLNRQGVKTKIIKSRLTPEVLEGINVLVIAIPFQPFLSDEKDTLKRYFLDQGGGLLLAGDFNNYMKVNTRLNELTECLHSGIKFNSDYVEKWTTQITNHPVTTGIETIFYTQGCSLEVTAPAALALIKVDGKDVLVVQHYSYGKIASIGSDGIFSMTENICRQCLELDFNLIKWLAVPLTKEELKERG